MSKKKFYIFLGIALLMVFAFNKMEYVLEKIPGNGIEKYKYLNKGVFNQYVLYDPLGFSFTQRGALAAGIGFLTGGAATAASLRIRATKKPSQS